MWKGKQLDKVPDQLCIIWRCKTGSVQLVVKRCGKDPGIRRFLKLFNQGRFMAGFKQEAFMNAVSVSADLLRSLPYDSLRQMLFQAHRR